MPAGISIQDFKHLVHGETNFLILTTWQLTSTETEDENWPSQLYYGCEYVCSAAISKQLNAAPFLRGVHEPFPLSREETMPAMLTGQCGVGQWPRSLVWEWDCACACVQDHKIVSYRMNSSQAVLWTVYRPAMKKLSGRRALQCGKHQFRAKITVSIYIVIDKWS